MRELGKLLAEQFADDRQVIHDRLEEALRDPQGHEATTGDLPRITSRPSAPSQDRTVAPGGPVRAAVNVAVPSLAAHRTPSVGTSLPALERLIEPRPPSRVRPALAIGFLAAAAFALSLWAPWRGPAMGAPVQAASVSTLESASAPVASRVAMNVRAFPQDARIFLDGSPLDSNPFADVRPADGAAHELRVEAPGFITHKQTIKLDQDTVLEISLVAAPEAPAELNPAVPAHKGAWPAKVGTPAKGGRSLDARNPYER
jgi:hypothetical protein